MATQAAQSHQRPRLSIHIPRSTPSGLTQRGHSGHRPRGPLRSSPATPKAMTAEQLDALRGPSASDIGTSFSCRRRLWKGRHPFFFGIDKAGEDRSEEVHMLNPTETWKGDNVDGVPEPNQQERLSDKDKSSFGEVNSVNDIGDDGLTIFSPALQKLAAHFLNLSPSTPFIDRNVEIDWSRYNQLPLQEGSAGSRSIAATSIEETDGCDSTYGGSDGGCMPINQSPVAEGSVQSCSSQGSFPDSSDMPLQLKDDKERDGRDRSDSVLKPI